MGTAEADAIAALPWRGKPEDRPGIPVPPEAMPLRLRRRLRKRWRWVGAFDERLMAFAAVVSVGPAGMTFWGVWDRERRELHERTRRSVPWRRREVEMRGPEVAVRAPGLELDLAVEGGEPIECACPNGEGGYTWTRKLAGAPVSGEVRIGGRTLSLDGRGVVDDSAGYHRRHTVWKWSAGVGEARDGRPVGWNLVSGINDPPSSSERTIWVDGAPSEPDPVGFEGLEAVRFADGSRLEFTAETERVHHERLPLIARSDYRAPFGRFSGSLGGIELESGLGVMESHDVVW
ncbi:MAG: DUF2804 domain-containing protein [Solirubrobacterales bacterium]